MAAFICSQLGFPLILPGALDVATLPLRTVPQHLLEAGLLLPLAKQGDRLTLAVADPTDCTLLDSVREQTGLALDAVVADAEALRQCLAAAHAANAWADPKGAC